MRPLSQTRIRILSRLASRDLDRDGAESAKEIAIACGEAHRASDWAVGALREMAGHGLVEPLGWTGTGARTWAITEGGRRALAKAEARG